MNQKSLSNLIASLKLSIVTFFLLPHKSFGVDPNFEACMPKNCGDGQNISFPFLLDGEQKSFCGYPFPGFRLRCRDGHPIFHISNNDYVVQKIVYNEQTLHVYNAAVSSSNPACFPAIRNVTFERDWFAYGPNVSNLFFLSNCSLPLPANLTRYELDCAAGNGTGWDMAMLGKDRKFSYAVERCNKRVAAPVEVYGDDERNGNEDYVGMLRRGFVLKWKSNYCGGCERSGGVCGFNETEYHFKCYCPDRPHAVRCNPTISINRKKKLGLILGTGASATGLLIAIVLFCFFRRKYSSRKSMVFWKTKNGNHLDVEGFLKNCRYLATNRYNYSDVKKMTNSFKEKLGQGGYGGVYKGKLHNGRLVAVKVLSESKGNGEEFINEVASISRTSHVNIVTLLGFCFEGRKRALIYEFMPNGSLEKFIYDEKSSKERQLGWETLYRIAVGIAQGLEYLHRGCNTRILHFDIKPHNILLDEDFCPKISDFGLAKLCPGKDSIISMLDTRGTAGFIAPEVFCRNFGGVSHKSDVYSYGMMILEMVGGRKNIDVGVDHTSEIYFPHWIYKRVELNDEIELHDIRNEKDNENARKMTIVGLWCIQTDPSNRPAMSSVVDMLEGSLESLQIPPKPFLSSPPRPPPDSSTT